MTTFLQVSIIMPDLQELINNGANLNVFYHEWYFIMVISNTCSVKSYLVNLISIHPNLPTKQIFPCFFFITIEDLILIAQRIFAKIILLILSGQENSSSYG